MQSPTGRKVYPKEEEEELGRSLGQSPESSMWRGEHKSNSLSPDVTPPPFGRAVTQYDTRHCTAMVGKGHKEKTRGHDQQHRGGYHRAAAEGVRGQVFGWFGSGSHLDPRPIPEAPIGLIGKGQHKD